MTGRGVAIVPKKGRKAEMVASFPVMGTLTPSRAVLWCLMIGTQYGMDLKDRRSLVQWVRCAYPLAVR